MYRLALLLLKLLFTIRRDIGSIKLEGEYRTLSVQIDETIPRNWEVWFKREEIEWVKGYRAAPPSLSTRRSSATPPPLDRAPEAQPEEKAEEEAEDPELLGWRHRVGPILFALILLTTYAVIVNRVVHREPSPHQYVIEAVPIS